MSEVAAPGWARLTGLDLGRGGGPSRGAEKAEKRKISPSSGLAGGFAESPETFGKPPHGEYVMSCQID